MSGSAAAGRRVLGERARASLTNCPQWTQQHWHHRRPQHQLHTGTRPPPQRPPQPKAPPHAASTSPTTAWSITPPRDPSHPRVIPHPDTSTSTSTTDLSHQVRALLRLLTHSVVICTATSPRAHRPRAMTMSSLACVTLGGSAHDPNKVGGPVVSFNVATPSRTLDAVTASRRCNIHVLADDEDGARIADWLARGGHQHAAGAKALVDGLRDECRCEVVISPPPPPPPRTPETSDMTTGIASDTVTPILEPPLLRGPGVLYVLRCKLLDEPSGGLIPVRDHVIVLAEVLDIRQGHVDKHHGAKFGLLYADRRYRQLGNCITPVKEHG